MRQFMGENWMQNDAYHWIKTVYKSARTNYAKFTTSKPQCKPLVPPWIHPWQGIIFTWPLPVSACYIATDWSKPSWSALRVSSKIQKHSTETNRSCHQQAPSQFPPLLDSSSKRSCIANNQNMRNKQASWKHHSNSKFQGRSWLYVFLFN